MRKIVQNDNLIFGNGVVTVQSMTNLPVTDVDGTVQQIKRLVAAGCDIVRIAVPNLQSAHAFKAVRESLKNVPLVADIHFDHRLAIAAMEAGADKIRINPGNMEKSSLKDVIQCAKRHNTIVRIGVNGGSVSKQHLEKCGSVAQALLESTLEYVDYFQSQGFSNIVLSAKSSDVKTTMEINRLLFEKTQYPIHLGVTEAGPAAIGTVKNAIGIGSLLLEGIGDTIRVSLTADPVEEVVVGKQILQSLGLKGGVTFVSCPQCGRCSINLQQVATEIYDYVKNKDANVKIAVMGCEVNGPGECADADLGLAGAAGKYVFFKNGKKYKIVDVTDGITQFKQEIDLLLSK